MDQEKFNKLFTDSIPIVDTETEIRKDERAKIINYLKELATQRSNINLVGAIILLEGNKDKR